MAETTPIVVTDLTPATEWRNRVRDFTPAIGAENQAMLDRLRDVVYGLALKGADERYISEYFGFDRTLVRTQLGPIIKMAQAELALRIRASNVEAALDPKANPITRIWAAKQHAGQQDIAPTTEVEAVGDGSVNLNIRVIKRGDVVPESEAE
jgi:hypothetical protein